MLNASADAATLRELHHLVDQGDIDAQFKLGNMYYRRTGVEQDYKTAMLWYMRAADQGHAEAQMYIGFIFDDGIGVKQNYETAAQWYKRAAKQGIAYAQSLLSHKLS